MATNYIFAPAGGVKQGWQTVLRSRSPFGPYEDRIVMAQGTSTVNGPHQGAWIETATGDSWFMHFQDKGAYGRVVHLQPMTWKDDWPVIGRDVYGKGCGEPVLEFSKPVSGKNIPPAAPQSADDFLQRRSASSGNGMRIQKIPGIRSHQKKDFFASQQ